MPRPEEIELDVYRGQIIGDVKRLVDKYRAIFDWDVPDIDQAFADRLILVEIRKAIHDIESEFEVKSKATEAPP